MYPVKNRYSKALLTVDTVDVDRTKTAAARTAQAAVTDTATAKTAIGKILDALKVA